MSYYIEILLACILGMLLGRIVIPQIYLIAFRCRLFDYIDSRKMHQARTPRLGGIAFFPCIFISVSLIVIFHYLITGYDLFGREFTPVRMLTLFTCLFVIYLLGVTDDLIKVKYRSKLSVQILCALLMVCSGCYFNNLCGLFGISEISYWVGIPLSVFVCVYMMNAFNFIDGIDGLASALAIIAFTAFGIMFAVLQWWMYAFIAFASVGTLLLFFYFNVIGKSNERKIFMGDTGSLTIGFLLTILFIRLSIYNPDKNEIIPHSFFIAFSFLIVPLFDVARVVLHRLRQRKSPFLPDRNHIHHKFIAMGFTPRQTLFRIIGIALGFICLNIISVQFLSITGLMLLDVSMWTMMHIFITRRINYSKRQSYYQIKNIEE